MCVITISMLKLWNYAKVEDKAKKKGVKTVLVLKVKKTNSTHLGFLLGAKSALSLCMG